MEDAMSKETKRGDDQRVVFGKKMTKEDLVESIIQMINNARVKAGFPPMEEGFADKPDGK